MSWSVDVSDYLFGELEGERLQEAERLLREDAGFRTEVERLKPIVLRLERLPAESWAPVDPPQLQMPTPAEAAKQKPSRSRRLVLRPALAFAASFLLLAVGVGAGVLIASGGSGSSKQGTELQLAALGSADPRAKATAKLTRGQNGKMSMDVSGLDPTRDGDFYEIWMLNSGDDLVSLGSFQVPDSGRAKVDVPVGVDPDKFKFVDVSLEPPDGDPGHSADSVLRGPISN